jgi:hypothetical protein
MLANLADCCEGWREEKAILGLVEDETRCSEWRRRMMALRCRQRNAAIAQRSAPPTRSAPSLRRKLCARRTLRGWFGEAPDIARGNGKNGRSVSGRNSNNGAKSEKHLSAASGGVTLWVLEDSVELILIRKKSLNV